MKKLILIIACLFLIGCQTNDETDGTPDETNNGVEDQVDNDNDNNNEDTEDPANGENDDEDPAEGNEDDNEDNDTDSDSEVTDPEDDDPVDHVGEEGPYTSDEAIILVQDYIQGTGLDTELNFSYDGDDNQGNYRIQVFEVVDHGDGESHTATYGWYSVDPETGEITDLMNQ